MLASASFMGPWLGLPEMGWAGGAAASWFACLGVTTRGSTAGEPDKGTVLQLFSCWLFSTHRKMY